MAQTAAGKVITVFNQKGGAGKTTTACQLAGTFGHRGFDVLVADLDRQGSASKWLARGSEDGRFPATLWSGHLYSGNVAAELGKMVGKYDLIFVDCAPAVDQPGTWSSLLVSDLAIIPTKLTPADIDAVYDSFELAKRARKEIGVDFPVRVLATAYRRNRSDERAALESLEENTAYPEFPLLRTTLGDRVAFTRSMLYGVTAHSIPKAGDAVTELDALADEISKILGIGSRKSKK